MARPGKTDAAANDLPRGLSKPARRALAARGVTRLGQLTRLTEAELRALHGMGPKGLPTLRAALAAQGLRLAGDARR